jgi:hypothetical protein
MGALIDERTLASMPWERFKQTVRSWMRTHDVYSPDDAEGLTRAEVAQWRLFRAEARRRGEQLRLF